MIKVSSAGLQHSFTQEKAYPIPLVQKRQPTELLQVAYHLSLIIFLAPNSRLPKPLLHFYTLQCLHHSRTLPVRLQYQQPTHVLIFPVALHIGHGAPLYASRPLPPQGLQVSSGPGLRPAPSQTLHGPSTWPVELQ